MRPYMHAIYAYARYADDFADEGDAPHVVLAPEGGGKSRALAALSARPPPVDETTLRCSSSCWRRAEIGGAAWAAASSTISSDTKAASTCSFHASRAVPIRQLLI